MKNSLDRDSLARENVIITLEPYPEHNEKYKNDKPEHDNKLSQKANEMGRELRENNEKIVECILLLHQQREELVKVIEKQSDERKRLENEMERITYKLCLINRSLSRRVKAKTCYDKTLEELEKKYAKLLDDSKELLSYVMQQFDSLDTLLDKRIGTTDSMKKIEQECLCPDNGDQALRKSKQTEGKNCHNQKPVQ